MQSTNRNRGSMILSKNRIKVFVSIHLPPNLGKMIVLSLTEKITMVSSAHTLIIRYKILLLKQVKNNLQEVSIVGRIIIQL